MKDGQERIPLRTILQNFINHIESLETRPIDDSYEKEFQELKFFSEILKTSKQYCCSEGEKEVNRKKNRYKDILPFDVSRVILDEYAGVPGSDYINANFIKGASGSPAYIASQGPLPHTVNDFWRMVVECEVQVIVMACNQEEAGKHKCENYWVEREGEQKQFGMVSIRLLKASIVCPDFLVRTMMLKYTNNQGSTEERTVCQFHYSAWPDHGVPPLVRPLLDMVRLVRDTQASETLPVLVHCSAGCGRTGTICAIDYVFGLLRAGKLTGKDFSLYNLVRDMRKQRIAMVQTKEQYIFVHQAVRELFCEQLRMIDAHPYENIDANGMPLIKEPTYATVNCEENIEKQDGKEKDGVVNNSPTDAPPLPHKKKVHVSSSKQEKEVENLSEKQRSIVEQSSGSESGSLSSGMSSLLSRPRISKLKALFERNSTPRESRTSGSRRRGNQQVTRSHSLGPVRNKIEADIAKEEAAAASSQATWKQQQPIPGRGILRVPQLMAFASIAAPVPPAKPVLPVKRSKSLKVLGSGERQKLSVLPAETTRLAAVRDQTNPLCQADGCDVVLVKSVASSIKTAASFSDKKPSVPSKALLLRNKDVETSEYLGLQARTSREGVMPSSTEEEIHRHRQIDYLTWRNYEHMPLRRRHSLESVILDEVIPAVNLGPCVQRDYNVPVNRSEFHKSHLDKDARKLLQDCRDYLNGNSTANREMLTAGTGRDEPSSKSSQDLCGNEQFQHLSVDAQRKINAIVAGLGVRERRDSFRQAVSTNRDTNSKVRDYESIWPGVTLEFGAGRDKRGHAEYNHVPPYNTMPGPSGATGEVRTTSNGYPTDVSKRNPAEDRSRYYQPSSDIKFQLPKQGSKSLAQKSGGSLRIKGSQALAFAKGSELEESGTSWQNIFNKPVVTDSKTKHVQTWARPAEMGLPRGAVTNQPNYTKYKSPPPLTESTTIDVATPLYQDPRVSLGHVDGVKVFQPTSDRQRLLINQLPEQATYKKCIVQSPFSDAQYNGIPLSSENANQADLRGPIKRGEISADASSNAAFQGKRVNNWSAAAESPSKPWLDSPTQKPSPRTNPDLWSPQCPASNTELERTVNIRHPTPARSTMSQAKSNPDDASTRPRIIYPRQDGTVVDCPRNAYPRQDGAITDTPRSVYRRQDGITTDSSRSAYHRQDGITNDSARSSYPRQDGTTADSCRSNIYPRQDGATMDSPRNAHPRHDGTTMDSPRNAHPRQDGTTMDSPRNTHPRQEGTTTDGSRSTTYPRQDGTTSDSPRNVYARQDGTTYDNSSRSVYSRQDGTKTDTSRSVYARQDGTTTDGAVLHSGGEIGKHGLPRRGDVNANIVVHASSDAISYGLAAGMQRREGSRDDLALCPPAIPPPRGVRRHASVVVMRRSQGAEGVVGGRQRDAIAADHWAAGAGGVDLDTVAASIKPPRKPVVVDQTATLTRALEVLHLRKSIQARSEAESLLQQQQQQQQQAGYPPQSLLGKKQQYL